MLSRSVPTDVDPAEALWRRARRLIKRTTDIDSLEPVVHARFDSVGLDPGAVLAQRLDVLRGKLAAGIDQRLGWTLGRFRAVIFGRQPLIVSHICFREQMFARGDPCTAFHDLPFQVGGIGLELLNQLAIDEQRWMRRFRLVRAVPVEYETEAVLRIDRKAVD